ncbi:MAG: tyrosine-type recombinase/integrase [Pseudomonadota bacterium]|nr:tyrosine-type recombinase/integrase [Pseudomonadota bacterium]
MKKQRFTGPMGRWMVQHLALRRSLGYLYVSAEFTLDAFDQFLAGHFPNCKVITRQMVVGYLDTTRHKAPLTRADHVSVLRQFCRFMLQFDLATYIPEKGLVGSAKVQVKPYIFTQEEVVRLMQQALQLNVKSKILPHTYRLIIGLLWVTGMRIGEVVRLKIEDIDSNNGILTIRQTKFFKSRMIPLLPSTTQKLMDYLERRSRYGYDNTPTDFVFINNRGKPCTLSTTPKTLHTLMVRAGLKTNQSNTPRVHDLRHSFATRWLMDIYQSDKDPNIYLPVLATYLGHTNIANTQVYLHPSLELLGIAGEKLHSYIRSGQGGSQ